MVMFLSMIVWRVTNANSIANKNPWFLFLCKKPNAFGYEWYEARTEKMNNRKEKGIGYKSRRKQNDNTNEFDGIDNNFMSKRTK